MGDKDNTEFTAETLQWARAQFPALSKLSHLNTSIVYFDGPGGSQTCKQTVDAISDYLINSNGNRGGDFAASRKTEKLVDDARSAFADFFNATSDEIIFGANKTTLTFSLTRAMNRVLSSDDEIIVTKLDHDANVTPWVTLASDLKLTCNTVRINVNDATLDHDHFRSLLTPRTKIVAVCGASNAVGTIPDLRSLIKQVRSVSPNAWVYVDGVHYAPHVSVDVKELDCDFFACSSYKFFGPHLGIVYGRSSVLSQLRPYKLDAVKDSSHLPFKFESGTQNFEGVAGALASVNYLVALGERIVGNGAKDLTRRQLLVTAMRAIQRYEQTLSLHFLQKIKSIPNIQIFGIPDPARVASRTPTFSIIPKDTNITSKEISRKMGEKGISVTVGNFYAILSVKELLGPKFDEGVVRIGMLHYNTTDEIDYFADCLRAIMTSSAV